MKDKNLIVVSVLGLILLVLYLFSRCEGNESERNGNFVAMEKKEVRKPRVKNRISGYRRERIVLSAIPEETPTDEGFLSVDGRDSIELCTDIVSGHPYRIIIEGERRVPLCQLLDAAGDSTEWDSAVQVLRFSNDSIIRARLMVGNNVFPFGISEKIDSISELGFCNVSFAEMINNSQDSTHSGAARFPILGSATILFYTAAQNADKLYLKVVQPGLLSVAVVYDRTVCGYPLFWDNDSILFEDEVEQEIQQDSVDTNFD